MAINGSSFIAVTFGMSAKQTPTGSVAGTPATSAPISANFRASEVISDSGSNAAYAQVHTIAAGGTLTLSLFGGSLLDVFNKATAWNKVTEIVVGLQPANLSSGVTIGGGTNPCVFNYGSGLVSVYKSGIPYISFRPAGWTVAAGSTNLRIVNDDGANAATVWVSFVGGRV